MGLLGFLKKKGEKTDKTKPSDVPVSIPQSEKKFYQPDDYYTNAVHEGTAFEHHVVTFEERKKTAIPSERGLYPAEILLLEYCSKGTYPGPKNGYPGFWWFSYGIRDVGAALTSLENRGYIELSPISKSIGSFTVAQLKELLTAQGQPTNGKKAELVERVTAVVPEIELINAGARAKYALTDIGQMELADNAYVPYMHSVHNKTTEDVRFGVEFNVWSINKLLGSGDKENWKAVVDEQERKMNAETTSHNENFMHEIKLIDPEGYRTLRTQEQQIAAVQRAKEQYHEDKDLDRYIAFWEKLWANSGLKFEGSGWHFELADLYIKAKRYDEALAFVLKLKKEKNAYAYKADVYVKKIDALKSKHSSTHNN